MEYTLTHQKTELSQMFKTITNTESPTQTLLDIIPMAEPIGEMPEQYFVLKEKLARLHTGALTYWVLGLISSSRHVSIPPRKSVCTLTASAEQRRNREDPWNNTDSAAARNVPSYPSPHIRLLGPAGQEQQFLTVTLACRHGLSIAQENPVSQVLREHSGPMVRAEKPKWK